MELTDSAETTAAADRCWRALRDVTDLPRWTKSITDVAPLDGSELAVGRRYRLTQPGLPPLVWTVTELHVNESFTWEATSLGVRTSAWHRLVPAGDGTRIEIGIRQTGLLAGVAGLLTGAKTRRYLGMEAAGLKAAAEAGT